MNSRNSTAYIAKVDIATKIRRNLGKDQNVESKDKVQLTREKFNSLEDEEKSAVTYLLNFLEFVAIGIRHNNLDEDLIKSSFKSILKANYNLFQPVIEYLREIDSPKIYNQLEILHKRWEENKKPECINCKQGIDDEVQNRKKHKFNNLRNITLTILTGSGWLIMIAIMRLIEKLTKYSTEEDLLCDNCKTLKK